MAVRVGIRQAAAVGPLSKVLVYTDDHIVSSDILGSPASCTFDSKLTMAHGSLVEVFGWYDNEWGYSNRLIDLALVAARVIGSEASCSDGPCGARVVVDPVANVLTHLVVEPKHSRDKGRLVPIALVSSTAQGTVLACARPEFDKLEEAEDTQLIPGGTGEWGYGQDQMFSWPYYGLGGGAPGVGGWCGGPEAPVFVHSDRVPLGVRLNLTKDEVRDPPAVENR
jgi:hypothetical protein